MTRRNRSLFPLAVAAAAAVAAPQGFAQGDGGNAARNPIEDVQIGERGAVTRIALVCRTPCRLESRAGGRFFLSGVAASMEIDLAGRSRNVDSLAVEPAEGGSLVSVKTAARVARASPRACRIDGAPAACVDLEFAVAETAATSPAPEKAQTATVAARSGPDLRDDAAPVERPALRGEAGAVVLAPPERLTPTEPTLVAAAPESPKERRPILRTGNILAMTPESTPLPSSNFAVAAGAILGKKLTRETCVESEAELKKDAWALDSMIDVGFCQAARGALEEADGVFKRLLAYTPDNYEALVGRALIAQEAGEKSVARKYFQDALNALPPIEESNRIVEAMTEL